MTGLRRVWTREEGIAITEYALLIAMIAVVLIAVVSVFGGQTVVIWPVLDANQALI